MANAVRQDPRSDKWNVVGDNGIIAHRGMSEVAARKLAADLTRQELLKELEKRAKRLDLPEDGSS